MTIFTISIIKQLKIKLKTILIYLNIDFLDNKKQKKKIKISNRKKLISFILKHKFKNIKGFLIFHMIVIFKCYK